MFTSFLNYGGGFVLMLKDEFVVNEVGKGDRLLVLNFKNVLDCNQSLLACFVHATPYMNERASFWSYLSGVIAAYDGPRIVIGDLNEIVDPSNNVAVD